MRMWCYGYPNSCSVCAKDCKGKKNNPIIRNIKRRSKEK